jgi:hypothetical protein
MYSTAATAATRQGDIQRLLRKTRLQRPGSDRIALCIDRRLDGLLDLVDACASSAGLLVALRVATASSKTASRFMY